MNLDEVSNKRRIEFGRRDTVDSVGGLGSDIRFAVDQRGGTLWNETVGEFALFAVVPG